MRSALLVALTLFLVARSTDAQTVSPEAQTAYADLVFDFEGEHYGYRLMAPLEVQPGKVYPLLVFLHGAGERGRDNEASLKYLPDLMAKAPCRQQFEFVLVPQARSDRRWVEADWGERQSPPMRPDPSPMMAMAMGLLDKVLHENPIDLNRVYLAGISMGGFGAWELAARMPETFAAVVPVCGGGDVHTARLLAETPLWAWHGDADTVVWPDRSRSMIEAIRKVGGTPKYTELKGVGHDSFLQAFAPESGVLHWLFEQHRGPARLDLHSAGTAPLRILAAGDSNTEAREFPGYRGYLKAELDRRGIATDFVGSRRGGEPAGDPEHEGYSGEGLARIRQRIREGMIEQQAADVMLLLAGSNDLWVDVRKDRSAVSPQRVDDLVRLAGEIFDAVHARRANLRLLVGLPATPGNVPDALARYRDGLRVEVEARRRKGSLIDTVDMWGVPNDGVHYTGEGFERMAGLWAEKIAATVGPAGRHAPLGSALHPTGVRITLRSDTATVFGIATVDVHIDRPTALNPFTDVGVTGEVKDPSGRVIRIDGFCDTQDGSRFAVRFMPRISGQHTWKVTLRQGDFTTSTDGVFQAVAGGPKGPIRVDKDHPLHFAYEGETEHFFWNSTTTYAMAGWRDEDIIHESLDRLARFKINRVRVAIIPPRVKSGAQWMEPAVTSNAWFSFCVNPWPAKYPEDVNDPGFDPHRFNVPYWQKYERLVEYARDRGIQVSVVFYVDGSLPGVDPFRAPAMGGDLEKLYYSYAVARLAAYSNVMWDVANEYRHFRDDAWAEKMGAFVREHDPYSHLMSTHGHADFHFRESAWADFAMYQSWDEHGAYDFMRANISQQRQTGRSMPQVNEEYGYEDHYPYPWGEARLWPARTADTRNRLSWQIAMAGGYSDNRRTGQCSRLRRLDHGARQ